MDRDGIVLGVRGMAKSSAIVELWTRAHGSHLGHRSAEASKRCADVSQENSVRAVWRARLGRSIRLLPDRRQAVSAANRWASSQCVYASHHLGVLGGCCGDAIRTRHLRDARGQAVLIRRTPAEARESGQVELAHCWPTRFGRPGKLRRPRRDLRPRLCLAKIGRAGDRVRRQPWRERRLAAPAFCARARAVRTVWSIRTCGGFRSPAVPVRHVLRRAGQGHSKPATAFINAVTRYGEGCG